MQYKCHKTVILTTLWYYKTSKLQRLIDYHLFASIEAGTNNKINSQKRPKVQKQKHCTTPFSVKTHSKNTILAINSQKNPDTSYPASITSYKLPSRTTIVSMTIIHYENVVWSIELYSLILSEATIFLFVVFSL